MVKKKEENSVLRSRIQSTYYREDKELGRGSYGTVTRLIGKQGERVARKELRGDSRTAGHGFPTRLLREVTILRKLKHRNIVRVEHVQADELPGTGVNKRQHVKGHDKQNLKQSYYPRIGGDSTVYILMECLDIPLRSIISRRLPDEQIRCYIKHLLQGLGYLNSKGILHLDIKPENLLINREGVLKIADFGLAREESDTCRYSPTVVTTCYRSPEIFSWQMMYKEAGDYVRLFQPYDALADMWSAGAVLTEMYISQHPIFLPQYPGTEQDALAHMIKLAGSDGWSSIIPVSSTFPRTLESYLESGCCTHCKPRVPHLFRKLKADAVSFISKLLSVDKKGRVAPDLALQDPYFNNVADSFVPENCSS
eukprot:TRINITY_DN19817_c0_g1_i1.p1 TRINITY_DN19817_c0_g1~~TRINITY_DN19817_c0_g1_i1.p1  ORF type:complete len:367 (+),score=39.64 TRINITY_DN19817_c0_g1_i1:85-1185(+)